MANGERIMYFANFNITFGTNEEPMLEHFEDIIYPAFISDFKRGKGPVFYFDEVTIKKIDDELVMAGNYIKDTHYDIHTTVEEGKLVSSPASVPTAPYSRFIVFLKNHRMILVQNESLSPDIRSFQATVRDLLNGYINKQNYKFKDKNIKLPKALVNIVDIPLKQDIETVLRDVKKIEWLRFRFFPLNNDMSPFPIAKEIKNEMEQIGSKHANIQFSSPESKEEIKNLIQSSAGLAAPTLKVCDADGNSRKIKEGQFSSNKKISLGRDILPDDDSHLIEQAKKDSVITEQSTANLTLYEKFKSKIERLIN